MVAPADELNSFFMYPIVLIVNMATEWKVLWFCGVSRFFSPKLCKFLLVLLRTVFQLLVYEHYIFCAFYDLNCKYGTEGCSVQVSVLCAHPLSKRKMQGTCSNELKDVEHTLWRKLILIGDKWDCIWREPFTSGQDFRNSMASSNFLTVNF